MQSKIKRYECDPRSLTPHPLNSELYGDTPDPDFVESIRNFGVQTPIKVSGGGTIISGHWRAQAAILADVKLVPIEQLAADLDDLEIRKLLIECNRHRPKTNEQRAREYQVLLTVEKQLAKRRQKEMNNPDRSKPGASEKLSGAKGEAKAVAAAKVGLSKPTAEKAATVTTEIDRLKKAGDAVRAAKLREKLNDSVEAAYRDVTGHTEPATAPAADAAGSGPPETPAAASNLESENDPTRAVRDNLKAAEKTLGVFQGQVIAAARFAKAAGVAAVDRDFIDARVREVFKEIQAALGNVRDK